MRAAAVFPPAECSADRPVRIFLSDITRDRPPSRHFATLNRSGERVEPLDHEFLYG